MRLPRDVSGERLCRALGAFGYTRSRQVGDHVRLTTQDSGEHHVTVPLHAALRVGTLAGIVSDLQSHFGLSREEVLERLNL